MAKEVIEYKDISTIIPKDNYKFMDVISTMSKKKYKDRHVKNIFDSVSDRTNTEILENHYSVDTYLVKQINFNQYLNYDDLCINTYNNLLDKGLTDLKKYAKISKEMFNKRKKALND